ncbi:MAG: asparagine synthase (glutamine-hydrolyzing) [Magnetococcales bacterium]|nr:asparagine synthase (glutamine-hydrolyzing) [Magnetococcales bacterium]
MCGVIGLFNPEHNVVAWPRSDMENMVSALSHRGPDTSDFFVEPGIFLGHTRLAVLDLSSAGRQPMLSSDGRWVISYNGEIYNFRNLRTQLQQKGYLFKTETDTEVILAAWMEWGEACLNMLDGIFAFALYNPKQRRLFLVRDHFGIKPLFYFQNNGLTSFASEPLAMFGPILSVPKPDPIALDMFFTFNYVPAPFSGIQDLYQLPPGHFLEISPQKTQLHRYWQLPLTHQSHLSHHDMLEIFQEKVRHAVSSQLVSDAPLGLFLSGGLDSSMVALAVRDVGGQPETFTLGFQQAGFDESALANAFAHSLGFSSHRIMFNWNEEEIRTTLAAMKELMADASCFPMFQLARHARSRATVILAGDGGDELLAGYDTYKAGNLTPWLRKIPMFVRNAAFALAVTLPADTQRYSHRLVLERLLLSAAAGPKYDHASFRRIFFDPLKQRLYEPEFLAQVHDAKPLDAYVAKMNDCPGQRSYLTARQVADLDHFLPSVLAKVDRMSMAHGLEVRVPLLNRDLVEFCFQLPDTAKRRDGKGKILLRQALAHCVPQAHFHRPKAGFLPPVDAWFRNPGPMANVFQENLDWASNNALGWLRWQEVSDVWAQHRSGRINTGFALLGILQFINWNRHLMMTSH